MHFLFSSSAHWLVCFTTHFLPSHDLTSSLFRCASVTSSGPYSHDTEPSCFLQRQVHLAHQQPPAYYAAPSQQCKCSASAAFSRSRCAMSSPMPIHLHLVQNHLHPPSAAHPQHHTGGRARETVRCRQRWLSPGLSASAATAADACLRATLSAQLSAMRNAAAA